MKIGIGIPVPERVHPDFALHSLPQIVDYTRKHLSEVELYIRYEGGVRTDRNRNVILTEFIDESMDYVLWLDADMVYPADIIERYLELADLNGEMSVIGCLYFKRSGDHRPIGYIDSDKKDKPYRPVMPQLIKKGKIYEVTGIGYGGMMVPMKVYEDLEDKKWTRYGHNFHNPHATEGNLTHDLEFCKAVRQAGHKIFLHGSVRPGHIAEKLITEADFYANFPSRLLPGLSVLVVMPTTDKELAEKTAKVMKQRAGYDCEIMVVEDTDRRGFIHTVNSVFESRDDDFIVYAAQDVFVGQNWLANALLEQFKTQAGLVAFNDGKWDGRLASFGLVERNWVKNIYGGSLFYDQYHSHYADTELTQIAKQQRAYAYAENAVMIEIDYNKALNNGDGVNKADKKLFAKRKESGFDKLVLQNELLEEFS